NALPRRDRRLEDVDRAGDVDLRAADRIGPAERRLERGEVDDVADPLGLDDSADRIAIGDVERDDPGVHSRLIACDEAQPATVGREVSADRVDALLEE